MKTFIKLILLVGVVSYLFFASVRFIAKAEGTRCAGLSVRIDTADGSEIVVDSAMVAKILSQGGIYADSMLIRDIDLMLVDSLLEADPYIQSANCYKSAMDSLCVEISIAYPIVRIMDARGSDYYIDTHGNIIPTQGRYLNVPIATGYPERQWVARHLAPFVEKLQADDYWSTLIEQIHIASDSTITLVPSKGDMLIHFGHVTNVEDKLERLRIFYEQTLPKVGWNRYTDLNCEYNNQIVCTKNRKRK